MVSVFLPGNGQGPSYAHPRPSIRNTTLPSESCFIPCDEAEDSYIFTYSLLLVQALPYGALTDMPQVHQ